MAAGSHQILFSSYPVCKIKSTEFYPVPSFCKICTKKWDSRRESHFSACLGYPLRNILFDILARNSQNDRKFPIKQVLGTLHIPLVKLRRLLSVFLTDLIFAVDRLDKLYKRFTPMRIKARAVTVGQNALVAAVIYLRPDGRDFRNQLLGGLPCQDGPRK